MYPQDVVYQITEAQMQRIRRAVGSISMEDVRNRVARNQLYMLLLEIGKKKPNRKYHNENASSMKRIIVDNLSEMTLPVVDLPGITLSIIKEEELKQ